MTDDVGLTREEKRILEDYDLGSFDSIDTAQLRADLSAAARNTLNE